MPDRRAEIGGLRPRADLTIDDAANVSRRTHPAGRADRHGQRRPAGRRSRAPGWRTHPRRSAVETCTVYGMPRAVEEANLADACSPCRVRGGDRAGGRHDARTDAGDDYLSSAVRCVTSAASTCRSTSGPRWSVACGRSSSGAESRASPTHRRPPQRDPAALDELLDRITINVTQLWRNPESGRLLEQEVLPRAGRERAIRAWSAGCSYGAEAYTLAAICQLGGRVPTMITGTDIDKRMVARARSGSSATPTHETLRWSR